MDDHIENRINDAEKDDTALTNDVYYTDQNTVIKVYPKFPLSSFYAFVSNLLDFRFQYPNRETRMRNEVEIKERIKEAGLKVPEIVNKGDKAIEFEQIGGISGSEFLENCKEEEARELGRKVGKFLKDLHELDVALRDFRISNMHVTEGLEIYLVDHEYSIQNAGRFLKWIDELTLFSSLRQIKKYKEFKEGYEEEAELNKYALSGSARAAFDHTIIFERSWYRVKRILSSIKDDLKKT